MKSMNMDIRVVGTSAQLFVRGSSNVQKSKVVTGKTRFFVIDPFCTPRSFCHNIGI